MHEVNDLKRLKNFFARKNYKNVIFLKCQSTYPTKDEDINFKNLDRFKKIFKDYHFGYSDHTNNDLAIIGAIFHGAKVVEKHISIKFNVKNTQDWKVSFDETKLKNMVKNIRRIEKMFGNEKIFVTDKEKKSKIWATKSIFSKKNILKEEKLSFKNIQLLRPGNGLNARFYSKVINLKAKKNIESNIKIILSDFK